MKKSTEPAKRIYFDNFGSFGTMKKNGEYKEYQKYHISPEVEFEWGLEIRNQLLAEIIGKNNHLMVVALSRINLSESKIISAFEQLASTPQRDDIFCTINQLKPLFDPLMFESITKVFGHE